MFDSLDYVTVDEARTEATRGTDFEATWYECDVTEMYPAVIEFLVDNLEALGLAYRESDSVLFNKAMHGDGLAGFVVQARTTVAIVLAVPDAGWELAMVSRDEMGARNDPDVLLRAQALEAARLFFTEAHHQATQYAPRGLHLVMPDRGWRLEAEGF